MVLDKLQPFNGKNQSKISFDDLPDFLNDLPYEYTRNGVKSKMKGEIVSEIKDEINVVYIPVSAVKPNPYQPRKQFDGYALEELCESIREYGIMQPITVREITEDKFEVIAGERRLRAARLAGLLQVPAIVIEADDDKAAVLALLENLQREDLSYIEEAEGYYNLKKEHDLKQEELAQKIGKSQSTIANKMRLLRLPPDVRRILVEYQLSERHARALLKIQEEPMQKRVLNIIIEKEYNVKKTEELIEVAMRKINRREHTPSESEKVKHVIKDMRILVNSIKDSVELLKGSGINARATQIDRGEYMEFIIRVPKKPKIEFKIAK